MHLNLYLSDWYICKWNSLARKGAKQDELLYKWRRAITQVTK
jgi:hypothetical protein